MAGPDYKKLAKAALEAVEELKDPERSIAYAKILDDLIAQGRNPPAHTIHPSLKKGSVAGLIPAPEKPSDPVSAFLNQSVDASAYVDLFRSRGKLVMKCLAVLKLARDELGIDGLGPASIAEVLTKKFRSAGIHRANISRDLGDSLKFVSPILREKKPVFILTAQGEEALKLAIAEKPSS